MLLFKMPWVILLLAVSLTTSAERAVADEAKERVRGAVQYWRDNTSFRVADIRIHRQEWERALTVRIWTQGTQSSLLRVIAPAKDLGNATLIIDKDMWTYSPKVNRVIRMTASMLGQGWMGSDFSSKDVITTSDLVGQYTHQLVATENKDGHRIYTIQMTPLESAPIVWGREILKIRDDHIIIEHSYFDQNMKLIKILRSEDIRTLGGKMLPTRLRMQKMENASEWTEVSYQEANFNVSVPANMFTLSNLSDPRR